MSDDSRFPVPDLNLTSVPSRVSRPAGFWIRFVAVFVDAIVVRVVAIPLTLLIEMVVTFGGGGGAVAVGLSSLLSGVATLVVMFFYYGWFYSVKGASPGKLMMNLKVLNTVSGAHLTYGRAFARETVGKFLSSVTLFVGYLMVAFREDKRALHDLMLDTQVIRTK